MLIPAVFTRLLLVSVLLFPSLAFAQTDALESRINTIDSINEFYPREKIFIHCDKPYYQLRDTIWLKGYILVTPLNYANDSSRIAYIELIDAKNEVVKRIGTPCNSGLFAASIALNERTFSQGDYILRAYTRYLRNFGDSLFFQTRLRIINPALEDWKTSRPAQQTTPPSIDLRFFPEGGTLLAGREQRLGFKAMTTAGKGVTVNGIIKDSKGNTITSFVAVHKGMGIVSFTPAAGETYTAFTGNNLSFPLPTPKSSGTLLKILPTETGDTIIMRIETSADVVGRVIHFTASTRGITAAHGRIKLNSTVYELKLATRRLLPGITEFTVYDENMLPLNGRCWFNYHGQQLNLQLSTQKEVYGIKDSVGMQLKVSNEKGEPVQANFSIAVIDTSQVHMPVNAENLLSYMLLSSDLKGEIEEPYYYLQHPDPIALESLMLTQGWISYERTTWPASFAYEKEFMLRGRVSNIFNKSLEKVKVTLFGKAGRNKAFLLDTTTNKDGSFVFSGFEYYTTDSISMVMKALNKRGKAFNVGIELDPVTYPSIKPIPRKRDEPDFKVDSFVLNYVKKQQALNLQYKRDSITLAEVVVTAQMRIPGSHNLNKDGGADQVINETTLDKSAKETLLRILETQVKGFHIGKIPRNDNLYYKINSNRVRLVIDGMDLHFFYQALTGQLDEYVHYLRGYLTLFNAEDVKGIEIMNNPSYNNSYRNAYLSLADLMASGPIGSDFSFIEITTRTGEGPFMKKTPGTYLLKPVFPVITKLFYSPVYSSPTQPTAFPDLRTTLYWHPDIGSNAAGEANISFYTSQSKGGYLVVIQGTDLNGNFGVLYKGLPVK